MTMIPNLDERYSSQDSSNCKLKVETYTPSRSQLKRLSRACSCISMANNKLRLSVHYVVRLIELLLLYGHFLGALFFASGMLMYEC
jgi:hypothetical protein